MRVLRPCFQLPSTRRDLFQAVGDLVFAPRHTMLFDNGELSRYAYAVVSGAVRGVITLKDCPPILCAFSLSGDFLGIGTAHIHAYRAETSTDTTLIRYRRKTGHSITYPTHDQRVEAAFARVATVTGHLSMLAGRAPEQRLASFLRSIIERGGCGCVDGTKVHLPIPESDIADHLRLTRDGFDQGVSCLVDRGFLLRQAEAEFELLDSESLCALGKPPEKPPLSKHDSILAKFFGNQSH